VAGADGAEFAADFAACGCGGAGLGAAGRGIWRFAGAAREARINRRDFSPYDAGAGRGRRARRRGTARGRVEFLEADALRLPFADDAF